MSGLASFNLMQWVEDNRHLPRLRRAQSEAPRRLSRARDEFCRTVSINRGVT